MSGGVPGLLVTGRYRLVESIGQGGMGRVWRATDDILDRQVAVKEMRIDGLDPEDGRTRRERTLREARATARIDHPNVVRVYDVVDEGERLWIVMELVPGRSLEQVMAEEGPLGPGETARVGLALVEALRQVHAGGVLHRDIKPGNVLVERGGRVVLTDFGIAAIQDAKALTMVGMLVGSPDYMAPERISGRPQGPPSDVWSLGATLCAALAGHSPFSRDTTLATLHAVLYEEPRLPAGAGPLTGILQSLLAKEPAVRASLSDLESALHPVAFPPTRPLHTPTHPGIPLTRPTPPPGQPDVSADGAAISSGGAGACDGGGSGVADGRPDASGGGLDVAGGGRGLAAGSGVSGGRPPVSADGPGAAGGWPGASSGGPDAFGGGTGVGPDGAGASGGEAGGAGSGPGFGAGAGVSGGRPGVSGAGASGGGAGSSGGGSRGRGGAGSFGPAQVPTERGPAPVPLLQSRAAAVPPGGELPGPAVPARRRLGRRGRIAAGVGAAAVGIVVTVVLAVAPGSGEDGGRAAGGSSPTPTPSPSRSPVPSASGSPSPTVEGTSRPPSLPPGAHQEAGGFAWATPTGWRRDVKTGAEVHYTAPDGTQELVAKSSLAHGDLMDTWRTSEQNARQGRDYRKIRLERTTFRGRPAVVWEYVFSLQGTRWHARLLGFDQAGKSYQINTWYRPEVEADALRTYDEVKESFTVL
ncbi:serine/threonine-protein kinase [Streptomyces sp. NPDC001381]|uniref:serine/threonine-protein kinase n=1 Tax=Streptomyces sp. NPDC001381 TaxID=3364567 RepID=UPI00367FBB8A